MSTPNTDAAQQTTYSLAFTRRTDVCVPDWFYQALDTLNLRVETPTTAASSVSDPDISTNADNILRKDSVGGLYVPAIKSTVVQEQTAVIGESVGPGEGVTVSLVVTGITDLATAAKALNVTVSPPEEAIAQSPYTIDSSGNLQTTFYRVDSKESPAPTTWPVITIRVSGRVYEFPQSQA